MKTLTIIAFVCAALVTTGFQGKNLDRIYQLSELKKTSMKTPNGKIMLWIMDTPSKRNEGMMFLKDKDVKVNEGMLFVFAYPQPLSFWMRNTLIPLDIAYIDKSGKILNVEKMKALDETGVPSKGEAMYALEMKQGCFKKFGIKAGLKLALPKLLSAKS